MSEELVKPPKKKRGIPLTEEEIAARREIKRLRSKAWAEEHREQRRAITAKYRKTHKAEIAARGKEYVSKNREKIASYQREYNKIHAPAVRWRENRTPEKKERDKIRATTKLRERLRNDPAFRLLSATKKSVNLGLAGIKKKKSQSANSYLKYFGCSAEELKSHIESQFSPEMSWENHGPVWHLDHIIPLRLGRGNQELLIKLCHFRNLRPLDKAENIRKKDSLPDFWPEGVPFTREELGLAPAAS